MYYLYCTLQHSNNVLHKWKRKLLLPINNLTGYTVIRRSCETWLIDPNKKKFKKTHKPQLLKEYIHQSACDEWAGCGWAHPSPQRCTWQHQCDRNGQITFSTLGTLCLGGDYYCHSFNGLAWTNAVTANGIQRLYICIAIKGSAWQQQVSDWHMEVAAQRTHSQSKAKQQGANYVGRNRVIYHSVRHLSDHTKETWEPQPASLNRDDSY